MVYEPIGENISEQSKRKTNSIHCVVDDNNSFCNAEKYVNDESSGFARLYAGANFGLSIVRWNCQTTHCKFLFNKSAKKYKSTNTSKPNRHAINQKLLLERELIFLHRNGVMLIVCMCVNVSIGLPKIQHNMSRIAQFWISQNGKAPWKSHKNYQITIAKTWIGTQVRTEMILYSKKYKYKDKNQKKFININPYTTIWERVYRLNFFIIFCMNKESSAGQAFWYFGMHWNTNLNAINDLHQVYWSKSMLLYSRKGIYIHARAGFLQHKI